MGAKELDEHDLPSEVERGDQSVVSARDLKASPVSI
jgi:hypothetical protein